MVQRILVLGTTGVNKDFALQNLSKYRTELHSNEGFEHLNLEDFILKENGIEIFNYLDADEDQQVRFWIKGWKGLKSKIKSCKDKNILLSMHAILARRSYGTRSPMKIECIINDYKPTKLITLISDVYLMWHRTHEYAGRRKYLGKPTLEELLQARRSEILVGDILAKQAAKEDPYPLHYVISVWHPVRVLYRVIFHRNPSTVYLSFPISRPRELKLHGDPSEEKEINKNLEAISKFEVDHPDFIFFCPLTIDEYPLLKAAKVSKKDKNKTFYFREFKMENRWNVRKFYGKVDLLIDESDLPEKIIIPDEEVEHVAGMIKTDVGIRDYRMVSQSSKGMVVLNPVSKGVDEEYAFSEGVNNEIEYALRLNRERPIYLYQNPKQDPRGLARSKSETGSKNVGDLTHKLEYVISFSNLRDLQNEMLRNN